MIRSVGRCTVTENSLRMVTVMCLVALTSGRFIDNRIELIESRNDRANQIADIKNRGWYPNRASNSEGPGTFAFGYDNAVDSAGNEHYRSEERYDNGTVIGEYGYTDHAIKRMIRVSYIADDRGYRAKTQILPMKDSNSRNANSSDEV